MSAEPTPVSDTLTHRLVLSVLKHYGSIVAGAVAAVVTTAITVGIAWGSMVARVNATEQSVATVAQEVAAAHAAIVDERNLRRADVADIRALREGDRALLQAIDKKTDRLLCRLIPKECR